MSSVNRVILIGHLGKDPDLKHLENGRALATFRIATTEKWNDRVSGDRKEQTEWHRIVAWGKTAELAAEYLAKGRQVCIEGRIQTRKWKTDEGVDRYTTEVVASQVTFLGSKQQREEAA